MIGDKIPNHYQVIPVPWGPLQRNLAKDEASAEDPVSGKEILAYIKQLVFAVMALFLIHRRTLGGI